MGHYRLVTGFDDAAGELRALDSYYGPKVRMTYGDFQRLWRGFGNTYLVVAPKNRQAKLDVLLGQRASGQQMWKLALIQAQKEVSAQPKNAFAWFNLGTAKLRLGDARGAVRAYDRARAVPADQRLDPTRPASVSGGLPWRMQWYQFGPLEAYLRVGRNADVVQLANGVLRYAPDHEEALYWRGRALAAVGKLNAARGNYQAALRFRPGYARASAALKRL